MSTRDSLQASVLQELKSLRRVGLARLGSPAHSEADTRLLEKAARGVRDYRANLTRVAAIKLLLRHEASLLSIDEYRVWLEALFNLKDEYKTTDPTELQKNAARLAGTDLENFRRTGAKRDQALSALAAQIFADCLSDKLTGNAGEFNEPPEKGVAKDGAPSGPDRSGGSSMRSRLQGSPRWLLVLSGILAMLVLASVVIIVVSANRDGGTTSPGTSSTPEPDTIRATLTDVMDSSSGFTAVFPAEEANAAQAFASRYSDPSFDWFAMFKEQLKSGAFGYGGVSMNIELQGLADTQVTVYNIRPVEVEQHPIPTGVTYFEPGAAGPTTRIGFDLDQSASVAKVYDEQDPNHGKAFFQVQRIGLAPAGKETLALHFETKRAAYSFQVAIDYEVDGVKATELVKDDGGSPFVVRATAGPCGTDDTAVPSADRQRLSNLQYDAVYRVPEDRTNGLTMQPVDPVAFVASGCA